MATRRILRNRADQLRSQGLTNHRAFRVLCKEFPNAERDSLVDAARLPGARTGVNPWWSTWGRSLRPTQIRYQQKGAPLKEDMLVTVRTVGEPAKKAKGNRVPAAWQAVLDRLTSEGGETDMVTVPTVVVPAYDVTGGDWIEGFGEVAAVAHIKRGVYVVGESGDSMILPNDKPTEVRLEDPGKEKKK